MALLLIHTQIPERLFTLSTEQGYAFRHLMTLSLFVLFTLNAPLHIIQGSTENLDSFVSFHIPKWSAVRQRRFGFGIIKVVNSTHLIYQQKDEKVLNGQ